MDYQEPPQIVITHVERHDVREETIEHVARLLCAADGCDPDHDMRCSLPKSGEWTVTCDTVSLSYPMYLGWNSYRGKAEKLLGQLFGPH